LLVIPSHEIGGGRPVKKIGKKGDTRSGFLTLEISESNGGKVGREI